MHQFEQNILQIAFGKIGVSGVCAVSLVEKGLYRDSEEFRIRRQKVENHVKEQIWKQKTAKRIVSVRKNICEYDYQEVQEALIHFRTNNSTSDSRYIG